MTWDDLEGRGVQHRFSRVESERFGLSVGRVVVGFGSLRSTVEEEFRQVLEAAPERLLIVRWPSHFTMLGAVALASGRHVIPADVLMYWELTGPPATRGAPAVTPRGLSTYPAGPDLDIGALSSLIRATFDGYANHYSANPDLSPEAVASGYVEWASEVVADESNDVIVLVHESKPVGFATVAPSGRGVALEVLLAGLMPQVQGRGWYRHLMEAVWGLAVARGFGRVIISTQAHNMNVQRAWAAMGLRPFAAFTTVHAKAQ